MEPGTARGGSNRVQAQPAGIGMRFEHKKATQHIVLDRHGAPSGTRTRDTLIKSQVLYQLS